MISKLIITATCEGFLLCLSLIVAIGAQNAFVLKQGLKREHLFLTAATCSLFDSILIVLGVTGISTIMTTAPIITLLLRWGGAAFLVGYSIRSFWSAFHPQALIAQLESISPASKVGTIGSLLIFTFLNPHTYVDTFLLLGTVGNEHIGVERIYFIIGAIQASIVWFFTLTYGASVLSPLFKNPRAWQIFDIGMGCVMLAIAIHLLK